MSILERVLQMWHLSRWANAMIMPIDLPGHRSSLFQMARLTALLYSSKEEQLYRPHGPSSQTHPVESDQKMHGVVISVEALPVEDEMCF